MISRRFLAVVTALLVFTAACNSVLAKDPFRFPEGKHGKGELKYVNGVPVLFLKGSPVEMGEQYGVLMGKAVKPLMSVPKQILKEHGIESLWPVVVTVARNMLQNAPAEYRQEIEAGIKASKLDGDVIVVANMLLELRRIGGCSSFIIEGPRSKTGGPIFGRNLDFPPIADLYKYSGVTITSPNGKHAFAAIGFPGMSGVLSGMNDTGLAVATHDVD